MKSLSHNGVIVSRYEPVGYHIKVRGDKIKLNPKQEEMAVAWVKKLGTDYVNDKTFQRNFFKDFGRALGIKGKITPEEIDFKEIMEAVEKEREKKQKLTREDKKALAEKRKKIREANKEKYGYAEIDGNLVELSNYIVEPSSIFMGRGKHPLRGRWKEGAKEEDVTLNLSPDSKVPKGNWKEIVWEPDYMWIAKWDDKLRGKEKYIWFSDSYELKQEREIEKFDKAKELEQKYDQVKAHITENLSSEDVNRRKLATIAYFIDTFRMRIGDEKDDDEAETVGATTLKKENIKIKPNNMVELDFLGKDSVRWHVEAKMPDQVITNLKEFIEEPGPMLFNEIRQESVADFFNEVVPGLTSKVFRTYHATHKVDEYLKKSKIDKDDPEYVKKYVASMSNLQAAIVCHHKRQLPKNWKSTLKKRQDRLRQMKENIKERCEKKIQTMEERIEKLESKNPTKARKKKLREYKRKLRELKRDPMTEKEKERVKKAEFRVKLMRQTKDYNLNTSLKSYISPRVYKIWCDKVDYDWKDYYPKTLQKKFSWVEEKKSVRKGK
ncbi:MAG: hypothetical protein JW701_00660 [Kosmotogaceae bacterium]|nr:hypothetical protein [Kosmotogaceae bacterium]